ncbi:amino acid ABC transporter, ATP-binding protein [Staphylococcus aureus]|nr:amino acid ABC transporter, ATP-binding protein [Staphylococcus aureus]
MIQLNNIHKSFNDVEVIKGIDLSVEQGEVVTLIGRSGSGKTTLLRMINALEIPTEVQFMLTAKHIHLKIKNHK